MGDPGPFEGERVSGRDELAGFLAELIFWAGPFHAMTHYSLGAHLQAADDNPAYLARNPLAAPGADLRAARGRASDKGQFARAHATNVRFGGLGDYEGSALALRPELRPALDELRRALDDAERTITARNATRFAPYVHLLPSRLANGVTL